MTAGRPSKHVATCIKVMKEVKQTMPEVYNQLSALISPEELSQGSPSILAAKQFEILRQMKPELATTLYNRNLESNQGVGLVYKPLKWKDPFVAPVKRIRRIQETIEPDIYADESGVMPNE